NRKANESDAVAEARGADMDRTPVGIQHRRQLNEIVTNKPSERKDQGRKGQSKCSEDLQILAPTEQDRCYAGSECERQAEVIEISEWNVSKDPWCCRVSCFSQLSYFALICRDPPNQPTRKIKENADRSSPIADLGRHLGWSIKV